MRSGGKRSKTTIGLISKKATLYVQHSFFVHFFAVVLHDYNVKNFQKLLSYTFLEEMSYVFSFTSFSHTAAHFTLHWWPLAFLMLSPPQQNFHVVLPAKNVSFVF